MENTHSVYFENDQPEWFVAVGRSYVGPMSAAEVFDKVQSQEFSFAHYIWRESQEKWVRICDSERFRAIVPEEPSIEVTASARRPGTREIPVPPPVPSQDQWFLYYNNSQFGPFEEEGINRFLRIGKVHGGVHAWKDGMPNWKKLSDLDQFSKLAEECQAERQRESIPPTPAPPESETSSSTGRTQIIPQKRKAESSASPQTFLDKRESPRRPLIAKILMANEKGLMLGVCRDISIGGMQVLTDSIPGDAGAKIKLNVSPAGEKSIEPFVAEGVVVRILEDGRGFSFRFKKLSESARRSIESYIDSLPEAS